MRQSLRFSMNSQQCNKLKVQYKSTKALPPRKIYKKQALLDYQMVDKSLMILNIIKNAQKSFIVTRPKGFGKNCACIMIQSFFAQEQNQNDHRISRFQKLKIFQHFHQIKQHFMNYFCLNFQFSASQCKNFQSYRRNMYCKIVQLYDQHHNYLINDDIHFQTRYNYLRKEKDVDSHLSIADSLIILCRAISKKKNKKIIIIFNNYDQIFNLYSKEMDFDLKKQISNQMATILSCLEPEKEQCIYRLMVFGVANIFKETNMHIHLPHDSIVDSSLGFHSYFGLSKQQIQQNYIKLFNPHNQTENRVMLRIIQISYGGYRIRSAKNTQIRLINPFSAIMYLNKCKEKGYVIHMSQYTQSWVELCPSFNNFISYTKQNIQNNQQRSFIFSLYESLISDKKAKLEQFNNLLRVKRKNYYTVKDRQFSREQIIYDLITTGYLTITNDNQIIIPNIETRMFYENYIRQIIYNYMTDEVQSIEIRNLKKKFNICLWDTCKIVFQYTIGRALTSFYNFCEYLFSSLTLIDLLALEKNRYNYFYEFTYIKQMRPDLILVPLKPQKPIIIVENKIVRAGQSIEKKQQQALGQIFNKNYMKMLLQCQQAKNKCWSRAILRGLVACKKQKTFTISAVQHEFSKIQIEKLSNLSQNMRSLAPPIKKLPQFIKYLNENLKLQVYFNSTIDFLKYVARCPHIPLPDKYKNENQKIIHSFTQQIIELQANPVQNLSIIRKIAQQLNFLRNLSENRRILTLTECDFNDLYNEPIAQYRFRVKIDQKWQESKSIIDRSEQAIQQRQQLLDFVNGHVQFEQ